MKILTTPEVVYQKITEKYEVSIADKKYIVYYEEDDGGSNITIYDRGLRIDDEDLTNRIQFMRDYTHDSLGDLEKGQEFLEEDFKEWKN